MGFFSDLHLNAKINCRKMTISFFYRQSTNFLVSLSRPYRLSVFFTLFVRCCHTTQYTGLSEKEQFLQVIQHQRPLLLDVTWSCETAAFKKNTHDQIPATSVWGNTGLWWFLSFGMYIFHTTFYQFSGTIFYSDKKI